MRSYVISKSAYGGQAGEEGKIYQEHAIDLKDLLIRIFGAPSEDMSDNEFFMGCETVNGDGQPYYMVFDTTLGRQIFG